MNLLLLSFALLLGATACSDDSDPPPPNNGTSSGASSGGRVGCATDQRVTAFAANLSAKSPNGRFTAEILKAEPAPPRHGAGEAGMNVWTMKFTLDGQPPAEVTPSTMMPDHGHGSPRPILLSDNGDGTFTAKQVFFFMAGVWEVKFAPANAPTEAAVFRLCLDTL